MKLSIPSMKHVDRVPVYTAAAHNKPALRNGTLHLAGTGFPWQREANVYIAGHRLGYPRTKSFLVFWDLNRLRMGRRVVLTDSEGERYIYRVYDRFILGPNDTSATEPVAGMNVISLQTCTLPNYAERLIVRAELRSGRSHHGAAPRAPRNSRQYPGRDAPKHECASRDASVHPSPLLPGRRPRQRHGLATWHAAVPTY